MLHLSPVTDKETEGLQRQNSVPPDYQLVSRKARAETRVRSIESASPGHHALSLAWGAWGMNSAASLWGD